MARKSDLTRERIMRAARDRFAREGFERTTIRAVAADAEIDPSMVMRYFASKEGLFAAAAEFDLALPALGAAPREAMGRRLAAHFLSRWEAEPSGGALQALLRTAASNEAARERLRRLFERQLVPALAAVVPERELALRAALVGSQMLGLALCRYILRLPGIADLPRDALVDAVAPTVQRYLLGDVDVTFAPPRTTRVPARRLARLQNNRQHKTRSC